VKILAFDTSSSVCSVGLLNEDKIHSLDQLAPMQHAQLILPMILEQLNFFSLTFNQLDAIAYGCGPGSFTGIRIANSVAQALGFAWNLPIIQISSLAVMAQAAFLEKQCPNLLVSLDARMGQIYWAAYRANHYNIVDLIGDESVNCPENVQDVPLSLNSNWHAIGDGWEKYGAQLMTQLKIRPQTIDALQKPTATALLELARVKFEQQEWINPSQAAPRYLR
jgi:tRNA threonylcarbamoyladenosine biosynthesis protein TsaB